MKRLSSRMKRLYARMERLYARMKRLSARMKRLSARMERQHEETVGETVCSYVPALMERLTRLLV